MSLRTRLWGAFVLLFPALVSGQAVLHLKTTPAEHRRAFAPPLKTRVPGRVHVLISYHGSRQEARQRIESNGGTILRWVPDSGFLVSARDSIGSGALFQDSGQDDGVAVLEASSKLSPLLSADQHEFVIDFHPDVDMADARSIVLEEGLEIIENPDLLDWQLVVRGDLQVLEELAAWDEVAYVFPASEELAQGLPVFVCNGPMTEEGAIAQYIATMGNGWDGPGTNAVDLGYYFTSLTQRIDPAQVRAEVLRAFAEWSKAAQIQFHEAAGATALRTINILFASSDHGDGYPFDGQGRTLAHTFYPAPPNPESLAGDMHFDNDESWQAGADIDLFSVALHEAGHALGLGHSDQPGAVMYPYYRRQTTLQADDKATVLKLYAAPAAGPPQLAVAVTSPSQPASTSAGSVTIAGTSSGGTAPVRIAWSSNRGGSGSAQGSSAWTATVPLSSGANTFTITATDAQQATAKATVTITRQSAPATPPSIRITAPVSTGSFTTSSGSVTLAGSAAAGTAPLATITWTNSAGGSGQAVGTSAWTIAGVALKSGLNTLTVTATASDGSTASAVLAVTCSPPSSDRTAPTLTVTSPASSNVSTSASVISVSGTASDNVGVIEVSWECTCNSRGIATSTKNWSTAPIPLYVGSNMVTVRARDAAGNAAWRTIVITRR